MIDESGPAIDDLSWDRFKDSFERIINTAIAGLLGIGIQVVADLEALIAPALVVLINMATVWLRRRVPFLPDPGQGTPGLRRRNAGLPR